MSNNLITDKSILTNDAENLSTIPVSSTTFDSINTRIPTSTMPVSLSKHDPGSDNGVDYGDTLINHSGQIMKQEEWWKTLFQVLIPFLIAYVATFSAGYIYGSLINRDVFLDVRQFLILVPALVSLKSNLDMCLASRISTQVNLGHMTKRSETIQIIIGNIALVQVQAIVASIIVALCAIAVSAIRNVDDIQFDHSMLLIASSVFTATSACFILDLLMVGVILATHKLKMNPDNSATPLAASIGDIISVFILSIISYHLYENLHNYYWISYIIIAVYIIILFPLWFICVLRNKYTKPILKSGWTPLISAFIITGFCNLVLNPALYDFNSLAMYSPIICMISRNLVSVQSSKMTTMLHQSTELGVLPPRAKIFEYPWKALFKGVPYAKTARILILMSIPSQVVFIYVTDYIYWQTSTIGGIFVLVYLLFSIIEVMFILYLAHIIIHFMWKRKIDPDNSAIPYLTAFSDLFGSCFMALALLVMTAVSYTYDPPYL